MKNHLKTHEKDEEFDDTPHTIQYHPDAEFKDAANNVNLQSKAWVYYLYNESTNEAKCRFCGQLFPLRGKKGTTYMPNLLKNTLQGVQYGWNKKS